MKYCILVSMVCILTPYSAVAQWEPDVRLTTDGAESRTSFPDGRCLAASDNVLHAVWYDYRDGSGDIYYKRSQDNGASWGPDTRLTSTGDSSETPAVAAAGDDVHVAWMRNLDLQICYRRSTDGGSTWADMTPLTDGSTYTLYPSLAAVGEYVHAVWIDARPATNYLPEVYHRRSTDGGATWQGDVRLSTGQSGTRQPAIAVAGDLVHIVWDDGRHGTNAEIYYRRSTDGGATWDAETRLTNADGFSFNGVVAAAGQYVYAAWDDDRDGNWEIYCKRSTDGGAVWGSDTRLTNDDADSYFASIDAAGNCVHITWEDARALDLEEWYKRSTDFGQTWDEDTRLTNSTGHSSYNTATLSGTAVHVLWHDNRDGNWEIYYKRNLTGNPGVEETPDSEVRTPNRGPTIVRGIFRLTIDECPVSNAEIVDISGRKVMQLRPGVNDISRLAPGVYFVRFEPSAVGGERSAISVRKVVLTR